VLSIVNERDFNFPTPRHNQLKSPLKPGHNGRRMQAEYYDARESVESTRSEGYDQSLPYPDRYAQFPANGRRCEFSGLGHGRFYQLLDGPAKDHVRVASLKEPGKKRGTRLFHVGDLLRYLDGLAAAQAADSPNPVTVSCEATKLKRPDSSDSGASDTTKL
jgi:hypothetical protein